MLVWTDLAERNTYLCAALKLALLPKGMLPKLSLLMFNGNKNHTKVRVTVFDEKKRQVITNSVLTQPHSKQKDVHSHGGALKHRFQRNSFDTMAPHIHDELF